MVGMYVLALTVMLLCAASPLSAKVSAAELSAHARSQFNAKSPGGIVLLAESGKPVLQAAYGLADVERGLRMRVDQALPIGSLTKSFTAAAILKLSEAGALSLSDDVRKHYPDAPVDGHTVSVEQLLTHTSGMPNLVDTPGFLEWAQEARSTEELLALTRDVPFLFEPGSSFAYSDSGYILLGAVLERMTGKRWHEAVLDTVARPLGLNSVAYAGTAGAYEATGYVVDGATVQSATPIHWSVPHASGALVANTADLLRWIEAWQQEELLSADTVRRAWATRSLPAGVVSGYGYGWKRCPFAGRDAIQHGGWVPGFTASLLYLPDQQLTAVALTNADGGVEATYLARQLARLWLTGSPDLLAHPLSEAERDALAGTYRTASGAEWRVRSGADAMYLNVGQGPFQVVALSPTVLCAGDSDGTWCFEFSLNEAGRAERVAAALTCEPQHEALRVD